MSITSRKTYKTSAELLAGLARGEWNSRFVWSDDVLEFVFDHDSSRNPEAAIAVTLDGVRGVLSYRWNEGEGFSSFQFSSRK